MKVAILGANGFVGSRLVERWLDKDAIDVVPIVRTYASFARLSRFNLRCVVADASDENAMFDAFKGCDVIVHSVAGDAVTVAGTSAPAYRAADRAGVKRMIYLSSASVHGQDPPLGTTESTPLNDKQWNWYNNAKIHAENRLLKAARGKNVEIVILRPCIVWGPRSEWVSDFAERLMAGQAYVVEGGNGVMNSIFVDNLVHAIEVALTATGVNGEAFFVQDRESLTWREFYEPLCVALGRRWSDVIDISVDAKLHVAQPNRFQAIRGSGTMQKLMPYMPGRLRRIGGAFIRAWQNPGVPVSEFKLPEQVAIVPTEDRIRLHTCQWRLPDDKARSLLGYMPPVGFKEGMTISTRWLKAMGYPVKLTDFVNVDVSGRGEMLEQP